MRDQKLTWSDEVRVIHEVPPDYVPNLEDGINFYAPEDRARIGEAVQFCMSDGTPLDLELQIITAKGRRVWVRAIGEAERDPDGAVRRIYGAFQDISTFKATEQALKEGTTALETLVRERDALLKEVHHRVKNNLQVVTSLLRLEGARSQGADLRPLKNMQNRIMAMAALHDTLYRSGRFAEIDLGPYLEQLVRQLRRSIVCAEGASIIADLVPVIVSLDQGIPCGLIINELITNALRGQLTIGTGPEAVFDVLFVPQQPRTLVGPQTT